MTDKITDEILQKEASRWKERCLEICRSSRKTILLDIHKQICNLMANYKRYKMDKKEVLDELMLCGEIAESFVKSGISY